MTNQEDRKFRVDSICAAVPHKKISKKKFVALQMVKWGLSRRVILEYVNTLIDAEIVNEDQNQIWR